MKNIIFAIVPLIIVILSTIWYYSAKGFEPLLVLISSIISASGIIVGQLESRKKSDVDEYQEKITSLNHAESAIIDLKAFISKQKKEIKSVEDILSSLKKEKDELKPIVEADKIFVKNIIRHANRRNWANILGTHALAFVFGLLASLLATYLYDKFIAP